MEELRTLGVNKLQAVFLILLRAGLWERKVEDLSRFPLSEDEWELVMGEARRQTVQALVMRGMQKLPPELMPSQRQFWKWLPDLARIEADYHRTIAVAEKSYKSLQQIGLRPILQKGLAVARFYEMPQWRINGDVDWCIQEQAEMRDIVLLLQEKGYKICFHADGSISYEEDSVEIELHSQLVDLCSPMGKTAVKHISQSENLDEIELPNGASISTTGPATTILMLEAHLLKHITSVGVGFRQFCDLARTAYVQHGSYDEKLLLEAIRTSGMQRWHSLLHRFLVDVLSMPSEALPVCMPKANENRQRGFRWLLDDVFRSGNFGHGTTAWSKLAKRGRVGVHHTLHQRLARLPFAIRYAPNEICRQTAILTTNRIKNTLYTTYEKVRH